MKTVLCLSGMDTGPFVAQALPYLNTTGSLVLLYVVDTRPAEEMGYLHRRHIFGGSGAHREHKMEEADRELARQVLDEAAQACLAAGFAPGNLQSEIRRGRPEREIIDYATQAGANLLVIGARYKAGTAPGPASIGPVARFVIDHATCNLLVIKRD